MNGMEKLNENGILYAFLTREKDLPCPAENCRHSKGDFKNIGSARAHYRKFHSNEDRLVVVRSHDKLWQKRPSAIGVQVEEGCTSTYSNELETLHNENDNSHAKNHYGPKSDPEVSMEPDPESSNRLARPDSTKSDPKSGPKVLRVSAAFLIDDGPEVSMESDPESSNRPARPDSTKYGPKSGPEVLKFPAAFLIDDGPEVSIEREPAELPIPNDLMVGMMSEKQMRDYLGDSRITPDGEFSIIDSIAKTKSCTSHEAARILRRILSSKVGAINGSIGVYKFEGVAQKKTPVADFKTLIEILSHLPGPEGKFIRSQNATVAARANAGDPDLRDAIHERGQRISGDTQDLLLHGMPSTEKAFAEREEKKEQEQRDKTPKVDCDKELLRKIMTTEVPGLKQSDDDLALRWEWAGKDRLEFVKMLIDFQCNFDRLFRSREENRLVSEKVKQANEEREEARQKRKRAEVQLNEAEELKEIRKKGEKDFYEAKIDQLKQVEGVKRSREETLNGAEEAKRRKLEAEAKSTEMDLQQKVKRAERASPKTDKVMLAHARRKIKQYLGDKMSKVCEAQGCGNYVSAAACFVRAPEDFVVPEDAGDEAYRRLEVVCPSHGPDRAFPRITKYQLPLDKIEVLAHRHGCERATCECAGCGSGCVISIHDAVVLHIEAKVNGGSDSTSNKELGCSTSNSSMSDTDLRTYRANHGVPYVPKKNMSTLKAAVAAKELRSMSKRKAKRSATQRALKAAEKIDNKSPRQEIINFGHVENIVIHNASSSSTA